MSVETMNVCGIEFNVYYTYSEEKDPLGTGDSPTAYYIEIDFIEAGDDTQNLIDIMPNSVLEKIENILLDIERS